MSLFSLLFTDTITSISKITKDGYGTITTSVIYTDVPCKFFKRNTFNYDGQFIDDGTIATVTIPPEYVEVASEQVVSYKNKSYIVASMSELKGVLGASQGIQIKLRTYA